MLTAPSAPATPAKTYRAQRSQTLDAAIARARAVKTALGPLLPGIAKADAKAKSVRIDARWVANLGSAIAGAEAAQGARADAKVSQKSATAAERATASELATRLAQVRDLVATHNPDDLPAQQAYGRGQKIDARHVPGLLEVAQHFAASYGGEWRQAAEDAGITPETMEEIATLADTAAKAGVTVVAKKAAGSRTTLSREAALGALRKLCAFAVRVVASVYGKGSDELATLTDPRPRQGRGAARKAATRTKAEAASATKAARKAASRAKPGARSRTRARKAKTATVRKLEAKIVTGGAGGAAGARGAKKGAKPGKKGARSAKPIAGRKKTGARA